jgi:hypothetical protein
MAVLTAKSRDHMKPSTFGLPDQGKYPMPDKSHAANAKARVSQQLAKGNISPADAAKVRHKANVVLGETDSTYHNN